MLSASSGKWLTGTPRSLHNPFHHNELTESPRQLTHNWKEIVGFAGVMKA